MTIFVMGNAVVLMLAFMSTIVLNRVLAGAAVEPWLSLVKQVLVPAATVLLTIEVLQRVRPRAVFSGSPATAGGSALLPNLRAGGLTALPVLAILLVGVAAARSNVQEWAVVAAAGPLGMAAGFPFLRAAKAGHCLACGYEVATLRRCPECGAVDSAPRPGRDPVRSCGAIPRRIP